MKQRTLDGQLHSYREGHQERAYEDFLCQEMDGTTILDLHSIKTSKSIDKGLLVSQLDAKHVIWKCFLRGTCGVVQ